LAKERLHVARTLRRSVAELRITQAFGRHLGDVRGNVSTAIEVDRIDEHAGVRLAACGDDTFALLQILDLGPWHRLEIEAEPERRAELTERRQSLDRARLDGIVARHEHVLRPETRASLQRA